MDQQKKKTWSEYYQKVAAYPHKQRTEAAVAQNQSGSLVALDCGCGTGSDTAYLLSQSYSVVAFDINQESVEFCSKRFADESAVTIHCTDFESFTYPDAGLVVANASLFFAHPESFPIIWQKIRAAIPIGGVFCGDFLGPEDEWLEDKRHILTPLSEQEVKALFDGFEILEFSERNRRGPTARGPEKHWHTFSVIARKNVV
ncbi:class I SAM-dependent methyltransferase [Endozoicomonas numazuensis]|uniref:SAM-dependent methyltransferase n=1 Tax=Endozoicomonas numazuensis TaxID=1137799 RepID=A0A081NFS9_9GAMM|nr:class I SAM-dependent methyltransferase [Endozoicomonas numazuensis]KEQ17302.1 SAM-dependent methyltransferase [Endozoicomonas numazuensis]